MKHTKTRRHSQRQKNIRKQYSGWKEIPAGNASEEIVQGCLVLEGGAFRGLYSQGVLDALMENGINMSCTIGVSAGALAGLNYVSGQIGRSARANLRFRHYKDYVGSGAIRHAHSPIRLDFLSQNRRIKGIPARFYERCVKKQKGP